MNVNRQHKITILKTYGISNDASTNEKVHFFDTVNHQISKVGNNRGIKIGRPK